MLPVIAVAGPAAPPRPDSRTANSGDTERTLSHIVTQIHSDILQPIAILRIRDVSFFGEPPRELWPRSVGL